MLRKKSGDFVQVVDSAAGAFRAVLNIAPHAVSAQLLEPICEPVGEAGVQVTVAQGIPKGPKMDFVVEKLTELGVNSVIPFYSERCIVGEVGDAKSERWRRIARTAARQCGRRDIPTVTAPLHWKVLVDRFERYDVTLLPWELAPRVPLSARLPHLLQDVSTLLIVVGPEGGFSRDEVAEGQRHGAQAISLGARILRTETAALAVCAVVNYLTGTC
ncbi:MAG: 16S rRNA (uracil(1498)-N(3))-methyltransferase [Candidatus Eremiobacteraeota bacterium]|nr:16S rRNA (uracil(1498)-N(3))-methyltransferase [Candidatus Eremiobacteraeota bacterium]